MKVDPRVEKLLAERSQAVSETLKADKPKKQHDYEPLRDMVLLEERLPEQPAGLVLPEGMSESSRKEYVEHYVLKIGPRVDRPAGLESATAGPRRGPGFKPGDRVVVRPSATPVLLDRETRRFLMHSEDILAVVR